MIEQKEFEKVLKDVIEYKFQNLPAPREEWIEEYTDGSVERCYGPTLEDYIPGFFDGLEWNSRFQIKTTLKGWYSLKILKLVPEAKTYNETTFRKKLKRNQQQGIEYVAFAMIRTIYIIRDYITEMLGPNVWKNKSRLNEYCYTGTQINSIDKKLDLVMKSIVDYYHSPNNWGFLDWLRDSVAYSIVILDNLYTKDPKQTLKKAIIATETKSEMQNKSAPDYEYDI